MKNYLLVSIIFTFIKLIYNNNLFCPKNNEPPKVIDNVSSFSISEDFSGKLFSTVIIDKEVYSRDSYDLLFVGFMLKDSDYCPINYYIPTKEDYESLINRLGKDAYNILTDPKGFNMTENNYYFTKTPCKKSFHYYLMYLNEKTVKIECFDFSSVFWNTLRVKCKLVPPKTLNLVLSEDRGEYESNKTIDIKVDNKYIKGHFWRIDEIKDYNGSIIKPIFTKSGMHKIEYWGKLVSEEIVYLCDYIYIKKKKVSTSQVFSNNKIKKIETNFTMLYGKVVHFEHSNSVVSPRIDGGYYVAFSEKQKFLHILSYDKNDNLIKDLNTTEKGYIMDITSTDYGFVVYIKDAINENHSYLSLYNKEFVLINKIEIMNNKVKDEKKDSDLSRQIIKYDSDGKPVYGMRFMFEPDSGKLVYSRGRIFLIFSHYNTFVHDNYRAHTGDTITTFNDLLRDIDFGSTWGASHSLIQSATFDDLYFWTAALSDGFPLGVRVEYTSKKYFYNLSYFYDAVHKKNNTRESKINETLAGYIEGNGYGLSNGKLGGILYFENLKLYALVYAKTPVSVYEADANKNIIYATFWNLENGQITNLKTHIVKDFGEDNNVMQLRAGKYGEKYLFIIYAPTSNKGHNAYGNVIQGTIPKVFVIELPSLKYIINDEQFDNLLMNTNEDLRTFSDGVLIWATSNAEGNLVINKIGEPKLDETYDDVDYYLTKKDLIEYDNEYNKIDKKSLSIGAKVGIALGIIFGIIILIVGVYLLYRFIKNKNAGKEVNLKDLKNEMLFKN